MLRFFRGTFREKYIDWDGIPRALGIPRKTGSLSEAKLVHRIQLAAMHGAKTSGRSTQDITTEVRRTIARLRVPFSIKNLSLQDSDFDAIARKQPAEVPFVTAFDGYPQAFLRLADWSPRGLQRMRVTVKKNKVLLHADVGNHPTYSVLALRFIIFDDPIQPYISEALSNICNGDVQDFASTLVKTREGKLHLYEGTDTHATRAASGFFTMRMSAFDFDEVRWPYKATKDDVDLFISYLLSTARHLNQIPSERQDFEAAALYHMQKVSSTGESLE